MNIDIFLPARCPRDRPSPGPWREPITIGILHRPGPKVKRNIGVQYWGRAGSPFAGGAPPCLPPERGSIPNRGGIGAAHRGGGVSGMYSKAL